MISFRAPWAPCLKVMTGISALILVSIAVFGMGAKSHSEWGWKVAMVYAPLVILIGSMLFIIRGYSLSEGYLLVRRLGWTSRIDLSTLISVEADRDATAKSIRTFGNGGLFCIAGAFWNKKLGHYRAFATDPKRAVVLKFAKRRVVITPENPEEFVLRIKEMRQF